MFEQVQAPRPVATSDVAGFAAALGTLDTGADTSTDPCAAGDAGGDTATAQAAGLIDQIRALEELKSATAAAQARVTARFAAGQRAAQWAAGTPAREVGKGVAAQVALARRDSPAAGSRHLGLAEALTHEMPHTLAALESGQLSEWRATLVVRETACLSAEHRGQVDAELAARPGGLGSMGNQTIAAEARRIGYRLDPHAVTDRARKAESDRRVTLRPAPDTMSWLSGLLPVKQGVAAYASLTQHADSQRAHGDPRSRGQIMADTLVERVTGQRIADQVPVEVNLIMTDTALLGDDPEPADLVGYGPIPAPLVRGWLRGDTDSTASTDTPARAGRDAAGGAEDRSAEIADRVVEQARVWLRRLYTHPGTGDLVAMESTRRRFEGNLRRAVILTDRRCRTPWCDAPIRHGDHPFPANDGGPTSYRHSQGLCEACNYTKQTAGWATRLDDDNTVTTTTPTGHQYPSRRPPLPSRPPPKPPPARPRAPAGHQSRLEAHLADLLHAV